MHFCKYGLSEFIKKNFSSLALIVLKLFCRIANINIAEDENEEEIIEKRRKQREELIKVCINVNVMFII